MGSNRRLTPKLSSFEVWAIALGGIIGCGAFVMPGTMFLPTGGPAGTAIAFAIAALVMMVIALNLHYMMNRHPSAGGAFVYTQATFGRTHGFICGWFLVLAYLAIIPQNATAISLISRDLMGNLLEVGPSYNLAGYDTYLLELVLMACLLVLLSLAAIRSTRLLGVLQAVFASCIVAGTCIIVATIALSPASSPANLEPVFNPDVSPLFGVVGVLAVAPWAFVGFDAITQMAEDMNFSPRKAAPIMITAIVMGALIYISLNASSIAVLPQGYETWPDYIHDLPNLQGIAMMPVFNAVWTTMGGAGLAILVVTTLGAILTGVAGLMLATSRLLFAMARDGVLPAWFGELHPKYGTPRNAIITLLAVSLFMTFFGRSVLGWIIDMSSIGASIAFLYTSLATMRLAGKDGKRLWQLAGAFGSAMSVLFIALQLLPIEALNSALELGSYVLLITWIVLGVNFFTPEYKSSRMSIKGLPDDFDELDSPLP